MPFLQEATPSACEASRRTNEETEHAGAFHEEEGPMWTGMTTFLFDQADAAILQLKAPSTVPALPNTHPEMKFAISIAFVASILAMALAAPLPAVQADDIVARAAPVEDGFYTPDWTSSAKKRGEPAEDGFYSPSWASGA